MMRAILLLLGFLPWEWYVGGGNGAILVHAEEGAPTIELPIKTQPSSPSAPSGISGYVFFDYDNDGTRDGSLDFGMPDIPIHLFRCTDDELMIEATTTDGAGYYSFKELSAGRYYIEVQPPPKYYRYSTEQNDENGGGISVDPDTVRTACFNLEEGVDQAVVGLGTNLFLALADVPADAPGATPSPAPMNATAKESNATTASSPLAKDPPGSPQDTGDAAPVVISPAASTAAETTQTSRGIPLDSLIAAQADWKNVYSKNVAIIRSTSGIASMISSSLLILIIRKTRDGFSTTFHRILLGMSASDVLLSFSYISFNAASPIDVNYEVWNAKGGQATCTAFGFVQRVGFFGCLMYGCSLNIFSLIMVKYNWRDSYVRTRVEPFLHGIPIGTSLLVNIISLVGRNFNDFGGTCSTFPVYEPPHCIGYEDGEVREGFKIPCGRGRGWTATLHTAVGLFAIFAAPLVVGVSLVVIYKDVSRQENRTARYAGAWALNHVTPQAAGGEGGDGARNGNGSSGIGSSIASSLVSFLRNPFSRGRSSSNSNQDRPQSRAVMRRAFAYSMSFFLTWSWAVFAVIMIMAGANIQDQSIRLFAVGYLSAFFNPLQGMFNLLIYMQPKVISAKRSAGGNLSWLQAFRKAFCLSLGLQWKDTNTTLTAPRGAGSSNKTARRPNSLDVEDEEKVEIEDPANTN